MSETLREQIAKALYIADHGEDYASDFDGLTGGWREQWLIRADAVLDVLREQGDPSKQYPEEFDPGYRVVKVDDQ